MIASCGECGAEAYERCAGEDPRRLCASREACAADLPDAQLADIAESLSEFERAEHDAMAAVCAAAEQMRDGHEGCVVEPPCGNCFRCEFDDAVDNLRTIRSRP
jgi:hypothetical protein